MSSTRVLTGDDAIEAHYLVAVALSACGAQAEVADQIRMPDQLPALRATALGAVHGRLGEGYPLPRAEVLAKVAELCGETPSEGPDHNASWLDGWAKGAASVCDALEARLSVTGSMSAEARADLAMFVSEQRKAAGK